MLNGSLYLDRSSAQGWRRLRSRAALLACLLVAAFAGAPTVAGATTGPTPLAHPPRFNVTKTEAAPYLGRFTLVKPHSLQLINGAYVAGYNERGFVEGTIVLYTYDAEGRETSVLGRTYEYHSVGDRMTIDIISPENQAILARMTMHVAGGGRLTGNLTTLMPAGKPEQMTLAPAPGTETKATESEPEPSAAGTSTAESSTLPDEAVANVVAAVRSAFRL
jgi:hypothetical protein